MKDVTKLSFGGKKEEVNLVTDDLSEVGSSSLEINQF